MCEKLEKIQNWFKYQRKLEVLKGIMKYEVSFLLLNKYSVQILEEEHLHKGTK